MAGVAQRIVLGAAARADRHHEAIGFDDAAVGHLDAHRPLHHYRSGRHHPHDAGSRRCSCLVRSDHDQLLFPPARVEPAGVFEPLRPRRQHRAERNPLPGKDFGVEADSWPAPPASCRGSANSDCTSSIVPPSARRSRTDAQSGSSNKPPVVAGIPGPRRPDIRRQLEALRCSDRAARKAGCRPPGRTGRTPRARAHEPRCTSTSTPAVETCWRAKWTARGHDVEGGDLRRPLLGCGDRDNAAARAQVGDPAAARQAGLIHDVDQQLGVFLRRIDALGETASSQSS